MDSLQAGLIIMGAAQQAHLHMHDMHTLPSTLHKLVAVRAATSGSAGRLMRKQQGNYGSLHMQHHTNAAPGLEGQQ